MIDFNKKMQELESSASERFNDAYKENSASQLKKRRIKNYVIVTLVIALVFSGKIIISSQNATNWLPGINFFNRLLSFVPIADKQLEGEKEDRINILLLGIGGESHEAGNLTDTIMIASFKPSNKQVSLVSLPRDLVSPTNNWRKINSINAYAEREKSSSGGETTANSLGELLQLPIHYYVRIDFNGFEKIINELGGVEVNVENSFTDYMYPIRGQEDNPDYYARFQKLSFSAGPTKMDGALALKYARSRHALGVEGSDFARARRQQLLLEAIKNKLFSRQTLLNPTVISKLANELNKNLSTNLNAWELFRLWETFKDVERDQIINKVLNDAPNNYLVASQGEDGAYILIPKTGNFSEIRNMLRNIFEENTASKNNLQSSLITTNNSSIFIANGTWIDGLASKTSDSLKQLNFKVQGVGNAFERNYKQTTIYDLTSGRKNNDLNLLKQKTGATQSFDSPAWLEEYRLGKDKVDFFLILGTDINK